MKNKSTFLFIYAVLIFPLMMITFSVLTKYAGTKIGYQLSYMVYLLILAIGVFSLNRTNSPSVVVQNNFLLYALAFVPVPVVFVIAFLPVVHILTLRIAITSLLFAVGNGIFEELFWRYTFYRVNGNHVIKTSVLSTMIFTFWHISLLSAHGMQYSGGAPALLGGAAFMGAIWSFVMFKTRNIQLLVVAHILVNFFAFSQLFFDNF